MMFRALRADREPAILARREYERRAVPECCFFDAADHDGMVATLVNRMAAALEASQNAFDQWHLGRAFGPFDALKNSAIAGKVAAKGHLLFSQDMDREIFGRRKGPEPA